MKSGTSSVEEGKSEMREIPGMDGCLASADGRIFSTIYGRTRWCTAGTFPPREKARHLNQNGYFYVSLSVNGKPCRDAVHRLIARTFLGPRPFPEAQVLHRNGIRTDCRVGNLRWGTAKENTDDSRRHGTMAFGEECVHAKLCRDDVALIRAALASGIDCGFLARRFGVSTSAVNHISWGKRWKAVNPDPARLPSLSEEYRHYPKRNSGEKNRAAKLSDGAVREIRRRSADGESIADLARAFGVAYGTIKPIVLGRTWRHVA